MADAEADRGARSRRKQCAKRGHGTLDAPRAFDRDRAFAEKIEELIFDAAPMWEVRELEKQAAIEFGQFIQR
jgi:hypothetical protein